MNFTTIGLTVFIALLAAATAYTTLDRATADKIKLYHIHNIAVTKNSVEKISYCTGINKRNRKVENFVCRAFFDYHKRERDEHKCGKNYEKVPSARKNAPGRARIFDVSKR